MASKFDTPEVRKFPVIPKLENSATSHLSPFKSKEEFQSSLGYPGELVENWQEITHQKLVHFIEQMPSIIYDAKKLHFKYWENLIKDEENRCGCR